MSADAFRSQSPAAIAAALKSMVRARGWVVAVLLVGALLGVGRFPGVASAGFAIWVAILSSDYDMGSIAELWRRPALYARFPGLELASARRGRLLVVMANGFGFNGPGQPMRRESGVLAQVAIGPGEVGFPRPAQTAVQLRRRSFSTRAATSGRCSSGRSIPNMSSGRFGSSPDTVGSGGWLGRPARPRVRAVLAGVVVLAALAVPPSVGAHLRSGTVAIDYRARIFDARTSAYSAQIFQSDRALAVTLNPGHVVLLVGYLDEPVFRLDASGLWVNLASPTAVVDGLVKKSDRVLAATPRWRHSSGRGSAVWHDARVQGLPKGVRLGVWSVPLIADGRRWHLRGELQRFPAPALWPWLGALAVLLGAGAAPLLLHRRGLIRPASTVFAVMASAASVLILFGSALDAYASPGTWIEAADAVVFIGVGIWFLFRGPERWRVAGAVGAGLVALAVGLLEAAVFLHPIVLAILPAVAARLGCVVAIGAGLDAAALGVLLYAEGEAPEAGEPPEPIVPVSGSTTPRMGVRAPGRLRD